MAYFSSENIETIKQWDNIFNMLKKHWQIILYPSKLSLKNESELLKTEGEIQTCHLLISSRYALK